MSERWRIEHLDENSGYADPRGRTWFPIRDELEIGAFGVNAWRTASAGETLIDEHDEVGKGAGGHEELYVILAGHASFTVDGEEVDAPKGTLVFVRDPTLKRNAVAKADGTTVLAVGGRRGEPFVRSDWEASGKALRYWTTKEWDKAIALLSERYAEQPQNANLVYNLACAESLGGFTDDALRHLEEAIALNPPAREVALSDPDFEPIRSDPRFPS